MPVTSKHYTKEALKTELCALIDANPVASFSVVKNVEPSSVVTIDVSIVLLYNPEP